MKRTFLFLPGLFLALILSAGCTDMATAKPVAENALSEFHKYYNEEGFGLIFEASNDDFKSSTNLADFEEFMAAVHRKLGKVLATENVTWKINTFNFQTSTLLQQKTDFENGEAIETFTFLIKDAKATLAGYNINSRALIVN